MTSIETIISNNTAAADQNAVPAASAGNDELGQDAFLQLLVAQLRYQDPMEPQDSSEFLSQTAQFTQVEKLEEIAEAMAMLSTNDQLSTIGNLVGKVVQHENALGQLVDSLITSGRIHDNGITLVADDGDEIGLADVIGVTVPTTPSDDGDDS